MRSIDQLPRRHAHIECMSTHEFEYIYHWHPGPGRLMPAIYRYLSIHIYMHIYICMIGYGWLCIYGTGYAYIYHWGQAIEWIDV